MNTLIEKIPSSWKWVFLLPITYAASWIITMTASVFFGSLVSPLFPLVLKHIPPNILQLTLVIPPNIIAAFLTTKLFISFTPKYKWACLISINCLYIIWITFFVPVPTIFRLLFLIASIPTSLMTGHFMINKNKIISINQWIEKLPKLLRWIILLPFVQASLACFSHLFTLSMVHLLAGHVPISDAVLSKITVAISYLFGGLVGGYVCLKIAPKWQKSALAILNAIYIIYQSIYASRFGLDFFLVILSVAIGSILAVFLENKFSSFNELKKARNL